MSAPVPIQSGKMWVQFTGISWKNRKKWRLQFAAGDGVSGALHLNQDEYAMTYASDCKADGCFVQKDGFG